MELLSRFDLMLTVFCDLETSHGKVEGLYIELSSKAGLNLPDSPMHRKVIYRYDQSPLSSGSPDDTWESTGWFSP